MKFKRDKKHIKKVRKTVDYKIWKLFDGYYKDSIPIEYPINLCDRALLRLRMIDIPFNIRGV